MRPAGSRTTVRPPEIVQTSAMDCGPVALAALLGAHGLPANADALRAVCATAVDGTSVDDLEEVAGALGLDAEQVVLPLRQVLALPEAYLPAILLTRTPDGYVHFVVAWRVRRGRVDLVDPAVGRRRVRVAALMREALVHELDVPVEDWAGYALDDEAGEALTRRLRAGGATPAQARARVEQARRSGAVDGVGALLDELDPDAPRAVEVVGEDEDGGPIVRVRGAVLVRAPRLREDAEVPPSLAHVLAEPAATPVSQLRALVAAQPGAVAAAAALAVLAGAATVAETLSAQRVLESGAGGGRLAALALAVAVALLATVGFLSASLAAGRRMERRLRELLLARVPRLGDVYVRSRPAGDLAERGHAIVLVRAAVELGTRAIHRTVEGLAATLAIVILAPAAWPAALALAAFAVLVPWWLARRLAEADHRARSAQGAIALQLTDALGAADTLRAHRAAPVLTALYAPLMSVWHAAVAVVQRRYAATVFALELAGLLVTLGATALAIRDGASAAVALLVATLGFLATTAAQELTRLARRAVPLRNVLARVLAPLAAELADPDPDVAPAPGGGSGAAIDLRDVAVTFGATTVLAGVDLRLSAGEHVAIVGASGAGKSSLVALLAGWLSPSAGTISLDGEPLDGVALARLRRATAWSDGSTRLHDASLADNARAGEHRDARPAGERLALVGLRPACERLGDTPIGPGGASLDGPEVQRLRLARALGRPGARLVLLDEALGALPGEELRPLIARAREVWRSATLVHVTHDVASAADFDRVIVVEGGRVVEDGPPAALAADARSRYAALLSSQAGLRARARARREAVPAPAPKAAPADPPTRGVLRRVLGGRAIAGPFALALLAGLVTAVMLVLAGDRLGTGVRAADAADLGWLAEVAALLGLAAAATGASAYLLGRAAVALGRALRDRALAAAPSAARAGRSVGERVARVLDLEQLETTVLGSGALIGFAVLQGAVACVVLAGIGQPLAALLLCLTMLGAVGAGFPLRRYGEIATRARVAATAHLVERLLSLRTVTLQEDPAEERRQRAGLLDAIERAHARVDRGRVAVAAALPRLGALAMIAVVALDPPADPARAAGVLGAILLGFGAIEMLGAAVAELSPAAAVARGARPLLVAPPADASDGRLRAPEARAEHLLHQPLAANALLGTGAWPPAETRLRELDERLDAVGLADLVERMPLGIGQPLGETGWRLSGGERARLVLVRALMTGADDIVVENPLVALDPETAMVVLDALDAEPREVRITAP